MVASVSNKFYFNYILNVDKKWKRSENVNFQYDFVYIRVIRMFYGARYAIFRASHSLIRFVYPQHFLKVYIIRFGQKRKFLAHVNFDIYNCFHFHYSFRLLLLGKNASFCFSFIFIIEIRQCMFVRLRCIHYIFMWSK